MKNDGSLWLPLHTSRPPAIHKKPQSPQAHVSQAIHRNPCLAASHAPRIPIQAISSYNHSLTMRPPRPATGLRGFPATKGGGSGNALHHLHGHVSTGLASRPFTRAVSGPARKNGASQSRRDQRPVSANPQPVPSRKFPEPARPVHSNLRANPVHSNSTVQRLGGMGMASATTLRRRRRRQGGGLPGVFSPPEGWPWNCGPPGGGQLRGGICVPFPGHAVFSHQACADGSAFFRRRLPKAGLSGFV